MAMGILLSAVINASSQLCSWSTIYWSLTKGKRRHLNAKYVIAYICDIINPVIVIYVISNGCMCIHLYQTSKGYCTVIQAVVANPVP